MAETAGSEFATTSLFQSGDSALLKQAVATDARVSDPLAGNSGLTAGQPESPLWFATAWNSRPGLGAHPQTRAFVLQWNPDSHLKKDPDQG
jgi:hypothetical protein